MKEELEPVGEELWPIPVLEQGWKGGSLTWVTGSAKDCSNVKPEDHRLCPSSGKQPSGKEQPGSEQQQNHIFFL